MTYTLETAPCKLIDEKAFDENIRARLRAYAEDVANGRTVPAVIYTVLEKLDWNVDVDPKKGKPRTFYTNVTALTGEPLEPAMLYDFDVVVERYDEGEQCLPVYVKTEGTFAMFPLFTINPDVLDEAELKEETTMFEVFKRRLGYNGRIQSNERIIRDWLKEQEEKVNG